MKINHDPNIISTIMYIYIYITPVGWESQLVTR